MGTSIEPVTAAPSPDEALALLNSSAPVESLPVQSTPTPEEKPKRKGGFPKGAKRGAGGKKIPAEGEVSVAPSTRKVYDGVAAGATTAHEKAVAKSIDSATEVRTRLQRGNDPALIEASKPGIKNFIIAMTSLLARITGRPGMKATDDEAELLATTGAPLLAMYAPDIAESSPEMAFGGAVLNYALPRFDVITGKRGDGIPAAGPVAVVEAPKPLEVTAPAGTPAARPGSLLEETGPLP